MVLTCLKELYRLSYKSKHNREIPGAGHSEPSGIRAAYLPNRGVQYYHNIVQL